MSLLNWLSSRSGSSMSCKMFIRIIYSISFLISMNSKSCCLRTLKVIAYRLLLNLLVWILVISVLLSCSHAHCCRKRFFIVILSIIVIVILDTCQWISIHILTSHIIHAACTQPCIIKAQIIIYWNIFIEIIIADKLVLGSCSFWSNLFFFIPIKLLLPDWVLIWRIIYREPIKIIIINSWIVTQIDISLDTLDWTDLIKLHFSSLL